MCTLRTPHTLDDSKYSDIVDFSFLFHFRITVEFPSTIKHAIWAFDVCHTNHYWFFLEPSILSNSRLIWVINQSSIREKNESISLRRPWHDENALNVKIPLFPQDQVLFHFEKNHNIMYSMFFLVFIVII